MLKDSEHTEDQELKNLIKIKELLHFFSFKRYHPSPLQLLHMKFDFWQIRDPCLVHKNLTKIISEFSKTGNKCFFKGGKHGSILYLRKHADKEYEFSGGVFSSGLTKDENAQEWNLFIEFLKKEF